MLPWSFSEEAAAEKHMAQLQHNMWVTNAKSAVLSIITGGGKWVEIAITADPLYQHLLLTAEKKFWRCVESGEPPRLFGVEPPRPRIAAVRVVDMSSSNTWAEFAGVFCRTKAAFLDAMGSAKADSRPMPERRQGGGWPGIQAKRSKAGAVSFDVLEPGSSPCTSPVNRSWHHRGGAGQGTGRAHQSGEVAGRHHPVPVPQGGRPDVPLCLAFERTRHRAQGARQARDRDRADHGDRRGGTYTADHGARPFLGGMGLVEQPGVSRRESAAPHRDGRSAFRLC